MWMPERQEVFIMKAIVNRTNGIVINIDEDTVYLSHIKDNVAFTVKVPVNNSGTIEKWLCSLMQGKSPILQNGLC